MRQATDKFKPYVSFNIRNTVFHCLYIRVLGHLYIVILLYIQESVNESIIFNT